MALAAGALSKSFVGPSSAIITSAAATGGTGPYTYQLYQSQTNGFTPGAGSLISGATSLTYNASNQLPGQTYYYVMVVTDTGNSNVTADSTQLTVVMEPSQQPNQFSITQLVGLVDLKMGPTNLISCQVAQAVATANPAVLYPGQAVKISATTSGGVPQVQACSANSDHCFGFIAFNIKDVQYVPGAFCEVAMWGSVVWLYATAAVAQFNEACLDVSYIGGVQPTGGSATIVGQFIDGASAAGLVRVMLVPNYAFTTA